MFMCLFHLWVEWWFVWSVVVLCLGAEAHPGGSNWQCKETGASAKPPRRLHAGAGAPSGNARLFMMCVCAWKCRSWGVLGWWALSVCRHLTCWDVSWAVCLKVPLGSSLCDRVLKVGSTNIGNQKGRRFIIIATALRAAKTIPSSKGDPCKGRSGAIRAPPRKKTCSLRRISDFKRGGPMGGRWVGHPPFPLVELACQRQGQRGNAGTGIICPF